MNDCGALNAKQALLAFLGACKDGGMNQSEILAAVEDVFGARAARAALSQPAQGADAGWQPIETAPKDARVLLYFPAPTEYWTLTIEGGRFDEDTYAKRPRPYWKGDNERAYGTRHYRENQPTHWMPLPAPPAAAATPEGT